MASLHLTRRQEREKLTQAADTSHPYSACGHHWAPDGALDPARPGADLDMDAALAAAAQSGAALEINASLPAGPGGFYA